MKKFAVVLLLIVSMLTLSLSACARGGDDVNDGNDYDDKVVTIVVGIKADSTEKAYLSAFSKAFNRVDKSVKISVQTFADYQQAMNNYIATDSMPDIVWCTGDYHAPYSSTGHYEDLTPYFERDGIDLSKYYKTSIDSARLTIDPKAENYNSVWFMPRDYNRLTIMYNKDIFDKAKMEYPTNDWTWEDFLATCRTLREKMNNNEKGLSKFMYPADLLLSDNVGMFTALTTEGGSIVDEKGDSNINATETQLAYEALRGYVSEGLFLNPTTSASVSFARNTIAMNACVRPVIPGYINDVNLDFVSYPLSDTTMVGAGCSGYAIASTSKHKEEAWKFIKFIGSEEGQRAFATTAGCVPVLKSVAEDENSAWRGFTGIKGGKLNHGAFIADSDRDLYLNVFDRKDPRLSSTLLRYMQDCSYACMHKDFNGRGSISGATSFYQKKINDEKFIG